MSAEFLFGQIHMQEWDLFAITFHKETSYRLKTKQNKTNSKLITISNQLFGANQDGTGIQDPEEMKIHSIIV